MGHRLPFEVAARRSRRRPVDQRRGNDIVGEDRRLAGGNAVVLAVCPDTASASAHVSAAICPRHIISGATVRTATLATVFALTVAPMPLPGQTFGALAIPSRARIEVFADANIRNVISQPGDASTATGALGMRYFGKTYVVTGQINVAGPSDTLSEGFGASMLAPATGRSLSAGVLDLRRRYLPGRDSACLEQNANGRHPVRCNWGGHAYLGAASSRWGVGRDVDGVVIATEDVPTISTGLGLSYRFFQGVLGEEGDEKGVAMVLDFGLATRHLRGDLSSASADTVRKRVLSSGTKNFFGAEVGLGIQYDLVKATLTYYYLSGSVPGLSRGQVVAGISIQASLNSGSLRHSDPTTGAAEGGAQLEVSKIEGRRGRS